MMINEIILQVQYNSTNLIIAAFTSIITVLGVYIKDAVEKSVARRRLRKEEERKNQQIDKSLQHNNDIQKKIKEILIQLQGYTECSRACLYAYHNGTKTHFGFSMNFVSMIEEKTDGIVAPLIDTFQNIPAGYFRTILDKVDKSQEGYAVIETDELDGDDKRMMERYQIAMSYDFKIGSTVYEGMVSLVWVNKKHILSEEQIDHIQQLVDLIYYLQKDIQKLPKF
jgi:hypothetical protein